MDKQVIIDYIRQNGGTEIPELQAQFNLTYKQARDIVREQVAAKKLRYEGGLRYASVGVFINKSAQVNRYEINTTDAEKRELAMNQLLRRLSDQRLERMRKLLAEPPAPTMWQDKAAFKAAVDKEMETLVKAHKNSTLNDMRQIAQVRYDVYSKSSDIKQAEVCQRLVHEFNIMTDAEFLLLVRRMSS